MDRRSFLKSSAAGLALILFPCPARAVTLLQKKFLALPEKNTPFITPNDQFYNVQYAGHQTVDVKTWSLQITGRVARPLRLRYEDILKRPAIERMVTLSCIDNVVAGELISNAVWKGINLRTLIEEAEPLPSVVDVAFYGADLYSDSISLDRAMNYDVFLAYAMNGETLPKRNGFPLRAVVPGLYGIKNVKWLTKIELVDEDYKGYWQQKGWTDDAFIKVSSRIDAPGPYNTVVGETTFRGIAFGGYNGIREVEVSVDGGKRWQSARLEPTPSRYSWVKWYYRWKPPSPGVYSVIVRATNKLGETQTDFLARAFPDGTSGLPGMVTFVD
jgi:DMSO/TMAO reductase YedYZ molybdopterin-dependent catalytic subunit